MSDLGDEFAFFAGESLEWAEATLPSYAELCRGIREADGWLRVRQAHELARMIDTGRLLSDRDIAAQAGHMVCTDCGWCVTCEGHNMWCATGGDEHGPDGFSGRAAR